MQMVDLITDSPQCVTFVCARTLVIVSRLKNKITKKLIKAMGSSIHHWQFTWVGCLDFLTGITVG